MRTILTLLTVLLWAMATAGAGQPPGSGPRYSVGVLPHYEARRLFAIWRPLLDALERETGLQLSARIGKSIGTYEQEIIDGAFDFAYMGPYHQVLSESTAGYVPLVRDVGADIHGILVVRRDAPFGDVQELEGKVVALPAPNAIASSMMIRAELAERYGVRIVPRYVHTHDSVYLNVVLGETAAGGTQQKTLAQMRPEIRDQLRVLYRTRDIPAHPISAHPRVPEVDRERMRSGILALWADPQSRPLLEAVPFKALGSTGPEDYEPIRRMGLQRFQE